MINVQVENWKKKHEIFTKNICDVSGEDRPK